MEGTLDDFDLRYVFRFLSAARKTGRLAVGGPAGGGRVFFRGGEIYHAESDGKREGFGRKLVKAGKITEQQLRSTLEYCVTGGKGLGEALVDQGLVERADLESVLCEEIQEVALGLFRNSSGRFSFIADEEVESDTLILVPVEGLLEEDSQEFKQAVPRLRSPSGSGAPDPQISLSPEEWTMVASIDGRRTVGEIAGLVRKSDFSVLRHLRRLRSLGLIDMPGDAPTSEKAAGSPDTLRSPLRYPPPPPPPQRGTRATPPPPPPTTIDLREPSRVWMPQEKQPSPAVDLSATRETEDRDLGRGPS